VRESEGVSTHYRWPTRGGQGFAGEKQGGAARTQLAWGVKKSHSAGERTDGEVRRLGQKEDQANAKEGLHCGKKERAGEKKKEKRGGSLKRLRRHYGHQRESTGGGQPADPVPGIAKNPNVRRYPWVTFEIRESGVRKTQDESNLTI